MRVLIIGGTSFIGPHVVRHLAKSGHSVTVFHRGETQAELPSGVNQITGDRQNLPDFRAEFKELAPDVVLDMILFTEQQARALVSTFEGIAGRIVAPSSMDVYRPYGRLLGLETGEPDAIPLDEDGAVRGVLYPYRSRVSGPEEMKYHYEKILVESVVMGARDPRGTILRLPAVYGPEDKQHRLFEYLKPMEDKRPAIVMEESKARWLWTRGYVENVAAAIALAVTNEKAAGRLYNVGEADTLTESEWVRSVGRAAGWEGEVMAVSKDLLPEEILDKTDYRHHLAVDSSRIRDELGYSEPISREEALKRTVAWEREHPPHEFDTQQFNYAAEDSVLAKLKRAAGVERK
jgi:nucleoside-diphosphate-sugar epimerase